MMLNLDLCYDVAWELFNVHNLEPEPMTRFMLSGKSPLIALVKFIKKAKSVLLWYSKDYYNRYRPRYSYYILEIKLDNNAKIVVDLRDPNMRQISRWTLSSVKEVKIDVGVPLPADIMDLLLNNSNFSRLTMYRYDIPTAKLLLQSRRFDYINMDAEDYGDYEKEPNTLESFSDICIDAEELKLGNVSLEKIFRVGCIKTNVLAVDYRNEIFEDSLLAMDVNPSFQSVKTLRLEVLNEDDLFSYTNGILKLLELLNTRLINLELFVFLFTQFHEFKHNMFGYYGVDPDGVEYLLNYKEKMASYKGGVKVEFSHRIEFHTFDYSERFLKYYYKELWKNLRGYRSFFYVDKSTGFCKFWKSDKIAENFERSVRVKVEYDAFW
ncbi:hypothetical protein FO519_008540 [Halicephalobus sp. NKZ332]|nr:hypothetical protein FO519_008540 [Halicephalobus sp. NKZ332]